MAGQSPKPRYVSFPATGVLTEMRTPAAVGGSGLTACQNLVYHRQNSWGKRTGSKAFALPNGPTQTPVSGFRWYRSFPSPLTKLVTYAQGKLSIGNDAGSLTSLGNFQLSGTTAPCFTSARDPQAAIHGADVLIVTGLVLPNGSFATGQITISGLPDAQPSGIYLTITVSDGTNSVTTPKYYVLGTDNAASIASQLVTLLNETNAFLNQGQGFPAFLGESFYTANTPPIGALNSSGQGQSGVSPPTATIYLGARKSGTQGNNFTYSITLSGSTGGGGTPLTVSPGSSTHMSGGGQTWSGPARYDYGENKLVGLSYMAPNAFTQCTSWHNHVWFWGDPQNPDTVFASDIFQPEAFTFMIENGAQTGSNVGTMNGPNNGGYTVGPGDGDPNIQACVPLGNALYIFKTASIYMIEGYDFQQGEYQFSVTPQVAGYGIPSPYCVAVLENELVFWTGRKFVRLAVGAYEPEHIGYPIPYTEGFVSKGQQGIIRAVAGDFQVKTALNNQYGLPTLFDDGRIMYRSIALWSFDNGEGLPLYTAVYDDEATSERGLYAWTTPWTGWNVGCWITQGQGPSPNGNDVDKPLLFFIDSAGQNIVQVGDDPTDDSGASIPWMAQSGVIDFASPELLKNGHRVFLNVQATAGANFTGTIATGRIIPGSGETLPYSTANATVAFAPTQAPNNGESYNCCEQYIEPMDQAKSVIVQFTEPGDGDTAFEVVSFGIDVLAEEAFAP